MLTKFLSRNHLVIPAYLAVFYLAIGVHVVHPLVHRHLHTEASASSLDFTDVTVRSQGGYHDQDGYGAPVSFPDTFAHLAEKQIHQNNCSLCELLAYTSLLLFSSKVISFRGTPAVQGSLPYHAILGSCNSTPYPIRAPPPFV